MQYRLYRKTLNCRSEARQRRTGYAAYAQALPLQGRSPRAGFDSPTEDDLAKIIQRGWILGFTDGEGCFSVSFNIRARFRLGIEIRPSFSVSQHASGTVRATKLTQENNGAGFAEGGSALPPPRPCVNYQSLEIFVNYFGGGIRYSRKDATWKYETRQLEVLCDRVIPFFQHHSLQTSKMRDFQLFAEICLLIRQGQHLNIVGLEQIIHLAYQMNPSGTRARTQEQLLALIVRQA